jgi:hypothetical protein
VAAALRVRHHASVSFSKNRIEVERYHGVPLNNSRRINIPEHEPWDYQRTVTGKVFGCMYLPNALIIWNMGELENACECEPTECIRGGEQQQYKHTHPEHFVFSLWANTF